MAAKSLSPHFQYQTTFNLTEVGGYDAIQAIVWADYGPMDNKAFMGVAQVQVIFRQLFCSTFQIFLSQLASFFCYTTFQYFLFSNFGLFCYNIFPNFSFPTFGNFGYKT